MNQETERESNETSHSRKKLSLSVSRKLKEMKFLNKSASLKNNARRA